MERYRFALQPRWIVSHVFVLTMLVLFVVAGFWQLGRMDEKRDRNQRITDRAEQASVPVQDLAAPPGDFAAADALAFRPASAAGTYQADEQVLVRSRSFGGAPGSWVLTPIDLGDGTGVLVNRGWIANSGEFTAVPDDVTTPSGPVEVDGWVVETETKGSFGATDPGEGQLTELARADVARVDAQVELDLLPFVLQLADQDPPLTDDDPVPVPLPELDEGPHLSYAGQWFIFAALTVVFYPLILRRRARELEKEARSVTPEGG
jgi:cytochrome oxidase assembly protein ShyY1